MGTSQKIIRGGYASKPTAYRQDLFANNHLSGCFADAKLSKNVFPATVFRRRSALLFNGAQFQRRSWTHLLVDRSFRRTSSASFNNAQRGTPKPCAKESARFKVGLRSKRSIKLTIL